MSQCPYGVLYMVAVPYQLFSANSNALAVAPSRPIPQAGRSTGHPREERCCLSDETSYPTLSLFQVSFQLNLSYSQGPEGGVRWTRNFQGWDFPKVHGQVQPV